MIWNFLFQLLNNRDTVELVNLGNAQLPEKLKCYVLGFGEKNKKQTRPNLLQQAEVDIVPMAGCNAQYPKKGLTEFANICSSKYVACEGDSGGPMVCQHLDGKYYLYGVVGWREGCEEPDTFGFYSNVTNFLDWINVNAL